MPFNDVKIWTAIVNLAKQRKKSRNQESTVGAARLVRIERGLAERSRLPSGVAFPSLMAYLNQMNFGIVQLYLIP